MNDLISRGALINDIRIIETYHPFDDKEDILENVLATIDYQPAVEAVPVVHGEWIDTEPGYHNGYRRNAHVCSNCHDYYTTEYDDLYFCPNCGADMRKKVE